MACGALTAGTTLFLIILPRVLQIDTLRGRCIQPGQTAILSMADPHLAPVLRSVVWRRCTELRTDLKRGVEKPKQDTNFSSAANA